MKSTNSDHLRTLVDFDGLLAFLRGQHPAKTAEQVEARSGIAAATVRKWLRQETTPSASALLIIGVAYGPEALSACLRSSPAWLSAAHRHVQREKLRSEIEQRQRELAQLGK